MANRVQVLKGASQLGFYKLRDSAECSMCIATCCHSVMFADHPCYNGNVLVCMPTWHATWQGLEEGEAKAYVQTQDWDLDEYLQLEPKLPGVHVDPKAEGEGKAKIFKPGSLEPFDPPPFMEVFAPFFAPSEEVEISGENAPAEAWRQFKDLPGAEMPISLGLAEDSSSARLRVASAAAGGA